MLNNEWKISGIEKGRTKRKKNKRKEETKKHGRSYDDRTIFRNAVSIWLVSLWSLYSINATRSRLTAIALRYQKREEKEEKKEVKKEKEKQSKIDPSTPLGKREQKTLVLFSLLVFVVTPFEINVITVVNSRKKLDRLEKCLETSEASP